MYKGITIYEDYVNGLRVVDIAKRHNTSNIYAYIPKDVRRNIITPEVKESIANEYLQGDSIETLCERYKRSRASIRYILKGYDIKLRKVRKVE
jgi:transposase-like protein